MVTPNVIVSISALPKSGKNHLAYTFPDPIKVYCFNGGAEFVKRKFPNKQIDVHNFTLPIVESETEQWALPVWDEFYAEYNADVASGKYRTLVLDTSTEVENFCRQATLEELQEEAEAKNKVKRKLATNEYLARNLRMNAIFARARNAGINLVTLQYLKPEWLKTTGDRAEPTGKTAIDGWNQIEAQADINIWMEVQQKAGKTIMVSTIKSNRFDRDFFTKTVDDTTYDELMAILIGD
jgi:hypothetical protein